MMVPTMLFRFPLARYDECVLRAWARIWSVLANHFISAGSHHDEKIAMYAIDSLRQLGIKYLERAELANFTFHNEILKLFVILMRSSRSETMIKSKVGSQGGEVFL